MSLILQGSTSGSITLQEPAVAGSTVLTLPAVTGTILTTTSPKAGNVIQVVQATSVTQTTTSSTSFVTTSFSATITPTSATSKVLILHAAPCYNNTANYGIDLTMYRGGSNIAPNTVFGSIYAASSVSWATIGFNYLDSPATTSATTYTVYFKSTYGGTVTYNVGSAGASIILLEIAA